MPDFRELFLQQWQRLEILAQRRFVDANLADEAMLYTQEAMSRNDWGALRAYEGRATASFATYFTQVAWRMLEDFSRSRFGRVHVPQWVVDQGGLCSEIFRLLCLERMPVLQVVEYLQQSAPGGRSEATIWACIRTILKQATDCGKGAVAEVATENELLDDLAGPGTTLHRLSPEERQMVQQREEIMQALHRFLTQGEGEEKGAAGRAVLTKIAAVLSLSSEERLMLKMLYQDGLEVEAAARLLGLNNNQFYGRQRRLLARIRKALDQAGVTETVHALLDEEPGSE
ncbi:sigma-70 family RNA polymerase sigma factor [Candidatus Magnetaquicoccus inordinatus]|uniref:sigma-70 family RNA polymerase sigma factor n=1 Tax=Candidatus Magnetaquicoccus inordinatus TaxID=2496818 RepID=UPI00102B5686|nr:sigma-70 family RNA polymerase sigma factor [Candidatus Magnetaquicoccus inordinatus]